MGAPADDGEVIVHGGFISVRRAAEFKVADSVTRFGLSHGIRVRLGNAVAYF